MFLFVSSSTFQPTLLPCLLSLMTINSNLATLTLLEKCDLLDYLSQLSGHPVDQDGRAGSLAGNHQYLYFITILLGLSSHLEAHSIRLHGRLQDRGSSGECDPFKYSRQLPARPGHGVKLKYKNKESFWHQELLKNTLSLLNLTHVYQHFFEIRGFLEAKENSLEIMEIYFESCVVVQ